MICSPLLHVGHLTPFGHNLLSRYTRADSWSGNFSKSWSKLIVILSFILNPFDGFNMPQSACRIKLKLELFSIRFRMRITPPFLRRFPCELWSEGRLAPLGLAGASLTALASNLCQIFSRGFHATTFPKPLAVVKRSFRLAFIVNFDTLRTWLLHP